MPAMPVTIGQPVPGAVPNMPHGACSGCYAYAGAYAAAADPTLTYFSAIAGQILTPPNKEDYSQRLLRWEVIAGSPQ